MKKFNYKAQDANGEILKAVVEAESTTAAAKLISDQGLFPLEVKDATQASNLSLEKLTEKLQRIRTKEKVVFTRQLATLIKSGLTVTRSLNLIKEQQENPKLAEVVRDLLNQVQGGASLADAMRRHDNLFSEMYISIVEAGEASGSLDKSLLRLADQEEKAYEINTKIRNAFIYPAAVLVVLVIVTILMVVFVLPEVGAMYEEVDQPVPTFTAILLGIANFITNFWYITGALGFAVVYGIYAYIKSDASRPVKDKAKLNAPVFKDLIKKLYMARFARTLGTLVNTGVPVIQALEIVKRSMNNMYYEQGMEKIISRVKAGEALSKPILADSLYIPLVGQMLEVGEETGGVGDSLNKVAKYYEDEVDQQVKTIQTLIEPATIVLLGLMVGFLIVAVLFPIYNLVSSIQ